MKQNTPYIAEFIGTFTLSFVVALSLLGKFMLPVPVVAAMTLMLFVYTIGHISGAHINPAITLGLLSIKKIKPKAAAGYLIAQCLGSIGAMLAAKLMGVPPLNFEGSGLMMVLAEAVGMFFFSFGVAAAVMDRVEKAVSGVVVGGSLLLGIIVAASFGSAGILNPAVTIAVNMFSPIYILGPIVGAVAGFNCYNWLDSLHGKRK